jgi:pimeloyl-ACP methyl ester carboxylesterase
LPIASLTTVKLNYLLLEPPTAPALPTLVMVHGLATSLAFWYNVASALAHRWRVLLFDLRGHGRSSMPASGYSPEVMARDLQALLDFLQIETADFVGHSYGGAVLLHLALQAPAIVNRLVLVDMRLKQFQPRQSPQNWPQWSRLQPLLADLEIQIDPDEPEAGYRLLTAMARLQVDARPAVAPALEQLSALYPQAAGAKTAQKWLKLIDTTTAWQELVTDDGLSATQLQRLQKPMLGLYGDQSPTLATGYQLQTVFPHLQLALVAKAGHFFPLSQPQTVVAHLERFLQFPHLPIPAPL